MKKTKQNLRYFWDIQVSLSNLHSVVQDISKITVFDLRPLLLL